jgi:hypothetical protein
MMSTIGILGELNSQIPRKGQASMNTLTPDLKMAVEQAGDSPVRLTDPETHRDYVLVSAEIFDRLLSDEADRRDQSAFRRAAKKNAKARLLEDA